MLNFSGFSIYEMARVLKPGGLMCIIAPASGIEHKYPLDCFRYYPDGFSALIKYIGFDLFEIYTQFEKKYYIDGSDSWKDSFMVAQKPTNMDIINF
ncbi:MAG: hypothetical protein U5K55_01390 [Aliarcobacter sp.]|nr:hypothetical protein [Aliarcobacter sp.]